VNWEIISYFLLPISHLCFSGFFTRLGKKGRELLRYIVALTMRTFDLRLCFKFLDRKKNGKFFFAVIA
jgi:hypothetical protein